MTAHGRRQLELDVTYPLSRERRISKYALDLYIYTPASLGLTPERYGVSGFLDDLKSNTRHTPASIPFASLVDRSCELSPLTRIRRELSRVEARQRPDEARILYELRTLANVHYAETRSIRALLGDQLASGVNVQSTSERLRLFLDELDAFLEDMRALHKEFIDPRIPESLREALRWTDEAVSLATEKEIYRLHDLVRTHAAAGDVAAVLEQRLGREDEYRAGAGYSTHVDPRSEVAKEQFVYRESVLKKWAQGAMYMSTETSKTLSRIAQVLAASAAAAAMAFAVAALLLTERLFASYSVPWAVLVVVAYIFKDRIKEALRNVLMASLPRLVADRAERLVDPAAGRTVGSTRERVRFCRPRDVPRPVLYLRDLQGNPFRSILPPEKIIHFNKVVRLNSRALMKHHTRLESITEILRLKLDSWLSEMDEPVNVLSCIADGRRAEVRATRAYHAYLVLQLSSSTGRGQAVLFKHRLVLSREGIVRTEELERLGR